MGQMFSSVLQRSSMTTNDLRKFLTGTDFALFPPAQSAGYSEALAESVHYLAIAKSVRKNTNGR